MPPTDANLREAAISIAERTRESYARTLEQLGQGLVLFDAVIEALRTAPEGMTVYELCEQFQIGTWRGLVAERLAGLDQLRRTSRAALFRVLIAEGHSISDIGRLFGLSRQLVSRILLEQPESPS